MKGNVMTSTQEAKHGSAKAHQLSDNMLRSFFIDELKDVYDAEKQMLKALPKMKKAATSPELQAAFEDHLTVTEKQAQRLEKAFELLEEKVTAKKCEAMAGLIEEGESIIDDTEKGTATRDVGLILAAQKVEHYEIASYGGLAQLARTLGEDEVAGLLEETLEEEKDTDEALTEIAENDVNYDAADEEDEG
jgi:ferritin-like metal-binding protein YciE